MTNPEIVRYRLAMEECEQILGYNHDVSSEFRKLFEATTGEEALHGPRSASRLEERIAYLKAENASLAVKLDQIEFIAKV